LPPTSRRSARGAALALVLASSFPAVSAVRVLPGVASADGKNGTRFESTVWITGLGPSAQSVTLGLVPASGDAPATVTRTVGAGQTLRIDDPVRSLFGLDGTFGALTVSSDAPFEARGRTDNVRDPAGRYGLALPSLGPGEALLAGESAQAIWVTNGPAHGFRTNVSVTLLSAGAVELTLYDESGFFRGARTITADRPLTWQAPVAEIAGDPDLPLARLEVRVLRGEATAYAAVVDEVTGDGIVSPAERAPAATAWLLDGAARAAGRNGTFWSTDVRLFNPGLEPLAVTVAPVSPQLGGQPLARTVPPRGLLELVDVLGPDGLKRPEGSAGAIRLIAPRPFLVAARATNRAPSRTGTYSATQRALPAGALLGAGRSVTLTGLSDDPGSTGSRGNLALLGGPTGANVTLTLRDASGSRIGTTFAILDPDQWRQQGLSAWLSGLSVPAEARLDLTVESGTLDAYLSVIDNGTGDAVVLAGAPLPEPGCTTPVVRSLHASPPSVSAGETTNLTLDATGGLGITARVVPGDLAIVGSVAVSPARPTTYRAVLTGGCAAVASEPVTVDVTAPATVALTAQGPLRGVPAGETVAFRGIPYAAPPTGALRLSPPVAPDGWSLVRDAADVGPVCPQLDADGRYLGAEGCLTLAVWTPAARGTERLPVMAFLHGGANYEGASSLALYDGQALASRENAVVVTLNYRLGALGFLAHPSLDAGSPRHVSGNYGVLDQIAALAWIQRNASAFGGDPGRVMAFGQSAGGFDVCALLVSPLAKGLFSRALVESGGCIEVPLADVETFGGTIASKAGCGGAEDVAACLRALPAEAIVKAVPGKAPVAADTGQLYGYSIDGWVIPEAPLARLAAGRHNHVPFAIGTTSEETAFYTPAVYTPFDYQAYVLSQLGFSLGSAVLAQYPVFSYPSPFRALVAITSDARFVCPARRLARAIRKGQDEPVFRYSFEHALDSATYGPYGAYHGLDLYFVFGALSGPDYTGSTRETALSRSMQGYWGRFAATGDPGGGGDPSWPEYDGERDRALVLDTPIGTRDGIRRPQCDFWDSLAP